jgi:hypothetical protein
MPIKFRCQHCRQLLGIARRQAGEVVDCPTCGRSVRVPVPGGPVEPVPAPELDLRDPRLLKALDELAAIGDFDPDDNGDEPLDDGILSAPEPIAEQVILAPPPPAQPVRAEVRPATRSAAAPAPSVELSDPLASLARQVKVVQPAPAPSQPADAQRQRLHQRLTLAGVAIVAFGLGYFAGSRPAAPLSTHSAATHVGPHDGGFEPGPAPPPAGPAVLEGRITYLGESGDTRPDRGARVIVLPTERKGTAKLSIVGFRPADSEADHEIAKVSLAAAGGASDTVDAKGNYRITLPGAGSYEILVLSHFQFRSADDEPNAHAKAVMAGFFDRPEQLLGRSAYQVAPLRSKGTGSEPWDYTFERPR